MDTCDRRPIVSTSEFEAHKYASPTTAAPAANPLRTMYPLPSTQCLPLNVLRVFTRIKSYCFVEEPNTRAAAAGTAYFGLSGESSVGLFTSFEYLCRKVSRRPSSMSYSYFGIDPHRFGRRCSLSFW